MKEMRVPMPGRVGGTIFVRVLMAAGVVLGACGCLVEREVTDAGGAVVYEDTEVQSPFETTDQVEEQVLEKEQEIGM